MKIKYFGHSCFLMETRRGTCILTDPYNGIGYPLPQVRADCVCCTHQHFDHNYVGGVDGVRQTISDAGEYVFEDVKITGIPAFHDEVNGAKRGRNIVYKFEADGVCVCHMGDIGQSPSEQLLGKIVRPDILLIPVGGTYTVDAAGALEYIGKIRPRVVVPMHYKTEDCTIDIAPADGFIRLCGEQNCEKLDCIDCTDLSVYERKIILLRRRNDGR